MNYLFGVGYGFILCLVVLGSVITTMDSNWKNQAIERGYALYCPNSGEFAWKGQCDDG